MQLRIYAEAMYGSTNWQVVEEKLVTGEHRVIYKNLPQGVARNLAERRQKEVDESSNTVKEQ